MVHGFDNWGWYVGVVPDASPRSTALEPGNPSTSDAVGVLRANFTGHAWTELPYDVPTVPDWREGVRAEVWERIKAERDRRTQEGGYLTGGKWFHSDTFSRTQQLGLVLLGSSIPGGLQWKTMDGSFVAMTQALAAQVFSAAAASDQALFARAESLRAQVWAADEPHAVDVLAGWPAAFGEQ